MTEHVFIRALSTILRDNRFDRVVQRQRTGKLDTMGLYRTATGSSRVFKKRLERKNKEYDCTVLIDLSGSMENNVCAGLRRYQMAADSAEVLHRTLTKAGIPTRIVGFNIVRPTLIDWHERKPDYKKMKKYAHEIATARASSDIETHVFWDQTKHNTWDDAITTGHPLHPYLCDLLREANGSINPDVKKRLATVPPDKRRDINNFYQQNGNSENNDAWAVHHVVNEMLERKGQHIVIVISDGQPSESGKAYKPYGKLKIEGNNNGYWDLAHEVREALRKKVLFVGIGIDTNCVKDYYPKEFCDVIRASVGAGKKLTGRAIFDAVADQLKKHVRKG